jgi:hypothetical protein
MDVDVSGKLHAIAGPISSSSANHPTCEEGCAIERIDVGTRTVEASIPFQFEEGAAVMILRADPQGGLLLGCYDRVLLLPEAP